MQNITLVYHFLYKNRLTSLPLVSLFIFLFAFCSSLHSEIVDIDAMSIEEKVGQILIVHFYGKTANEDSDILINKLYVGGFIYYEWANQLISPERVTNLSNSLQLSTKKNPHSIPLFICVDQEGGKISRLKKGFTAFPSNHVLGKFNDLDLTFQNADKMAAELKAVGINWNLAPVVDIAKIGSYMEERSYGCHSDLVISHAQQFLKAFEKQNVITCLKHFPGHGSVFIDSHENLPTQTKTLEQLLETDLKPFVILSKLSPAIMTAHIKVESLDNQRCSTLSPIILIDLLRKKLGYEGVIISDSLVMEGVIKNYASIEEVAIKAFNAGCDILLLGGKQLLGKNQNLELTIADIEKIHTALVQAVKSGLISEDKLNQSVKRILQLKKKIRK